jgi:putative tricarboxylic transport membrane protein
MNQTNPADGAIPSAEPPSDGGAVPSAAWQARVGGAVVLLAIGMGWGASHVPGDAGYGGVGPGFIPWVCAVVLAICGLWLIWEARTGGYRHAADPGGQAKADLGAFVWVSAGMLLNAGLIEHLGFILSCTLCYVLAVQGLRRAAKQTHTLSGRGLLKDLLVGLAIAAPVFWASTQFLAINLPGLTETGWL